MTDAPYDYDYAGYEGDSWERLDWIDRRPDYELVINSDDGSQKNYRRAANRIYWN